jgi:undecaprenyl-phosphate 4-deoxy-4-formamido-L-arabinose transferase
VTAFPPIRRPLLESIFPYNLNYTYVDGLLAWNTRRVGQVLVEHQPRMQGRSGYSLTKLVVLALNLGTNFSLLPLQMVSLLGLLTACFGLTLAAVFLVLYFMGRIDVLGYASTIVSILVLGGIQLLSLGIMGEYLGRIHLNINRKPQYVERHVFGPGAPASPPRVMTAAEETPPLTTGPSSNGLS